MANPPQEGPIGEQFPVLDILSQTRLVVGAGTDNVITTKTQFFIFGLGELLRDGEGREYEALELIREYAKVIHVQKTICTVESTQTTQKDMTDSVFFSSLSGQSQPRR